MTKKLEALQQLRAVKQAKPGRCSTTCVLGSLIIWIP
jgi:hypothetical protein